MQQQLTYKLEQLAGLLGLSVPYLRGKKRAQLEAKGFPPPLPGLGLTWSKQAVDSWINNNGEAAPAVTVTVTDPIEQNQADLEKEYGGQAA